ncbi:MAG: AAA family ATPase [Candidatus Magasanikbacteria bacterium]|nr:AAA family ATPase [Candidatus Magasanikbacteria bacterium]
MKKSWSDFLRASNAKKKSSESDEDERDSFNILFEKDNPIAEQFRASATFKNLQPCLHAIYSDPEARLAWEQGMQRHSSQWENVNGNWIEYRLIDGRRKALEKNYDELQQEKFNARAKPARERRRTLQDDLAAKELELAVVRSEQEVLRQKSPELAAKILASELEARRKELQTKDGFMWFPSRRAILETIEARMADKNTLRLITLEGQAGTGKTSFVRALANKFTKENPVEVTVKSKTKVDRQLLADETLDSSHPVVYRPILKAITGKARPEDKPTGDGRIAFVDELNKGDNDEIGDLATVLDGLKVGGVTHYEGMGANPNDKVLPNALVLAAQNPAGARFLNRTKFTPEVQRKMDMIQLDYFPQTNDNPELYEAFLVALMDQDGRIQAKKSEMSPVWVAQSIKDNNGQEIGVQDSLVTDVKHGGMLWRVAEMLHQSYENLAKRKNALTDSNSDAHIQGRVLPPGDIMAWLAMYRKEVKKGISLEHFISTKFFDWLESSFTADHDQEDKRLYLELAEKYSIIQKTAAGEYQAMPQNKIEIDTLTQRDVAELSPRVPRHFIPKEKEARPSDYARGIIDWTAPDGRIHRRVEFRYEKIALPKFFRLPDSKDDAPMYQIVGTIKECESLPELIGKPYFKKVEKDTNQESPTSFIVRDSLNPYREALLAGGIVASDPAVAERKDMAIDLIQLLSQDQSSYQAAGLAEWAKSLNNLESRLSALSPEKRKIVEQEIKDGSIPVFMPGKDIQFSLTVEQLTKQLKPLWIKNSQAQTVADGYLELDYFINLIQTKAKELLVDVPANPYILLTKPTQAPDVRTCDKTLDLQKAELQAINKERKKQNQATAYSMNPHEYAALQVLFTKRTQSESAVPLTDLTPLDSNTWTRFIHLPFSSGGSVPSGCFYPDDRRLGFGWGGAAGADAGGGFRLSVRTEI